ncbi:MAG: ABC transporter ATP-binding protein, partial [Flavobacterium sp.]|nr:ABC transporter ATP-binding protein [Flavobacterium sp.]
MNEFEKQFEELQNFLKFDDFSILTKRIIDLTLDTEDLNQYKKTNDFLNWLDLNEENVSEKKGKYEQILNELHAFLSQKPIAERKILVQTSKLEKSYGINRFGLGPIDLELRQGEIL